MLAYYDAQTRKDADAAAAFWSRSGTTRMTRETFLAVFGAGDAQYTPEILTVAIAGREARVRVSVDIARTIIRNDVPSIRHDIQVNAELWRLEGDTWLLAPGRAARGGFRGRAARGRSPARARACSPTVPTN